MIHRCENPADLSYAEYGGRGISVCERWKKFDAFWKDMGESYFDGAQIDRKDNNAGYSPENCQWATPKENSRNRRNSRFISRGGQTHTLEGWREELSSLSFNDALKRLGISLERAIEILID
jgi:hypothetical protein